MADSEQDNQMPSTSQYNIPPYNYQEPTIRPGNISVKPEFNEVPEKRRVGRPRKNVAEQRDYYPNAGSVGYGLEATPPNPEVPIVKRKRGRPRKSDTIERYGINASLPPRPENAPSATPVYSMPIGNERLKRALEGTLPHPSMSLDETVSNYQSVPSIKIQKKFGQYTQCMAAEQPNQPGNNYSPGTIIDSLQKFVDKDQTDNYNRPHPISVKQETAYGLQQPKVTHNPTFPNADASSAPQNVYSTEYNNNPASVFPSTSINIPSQVPAQNFENYGYVPPNPPLVEHVRKRGRPRKIPLPVPLDLTKEIHPTEDSNQPKRRGRKKKSETDTEKYKEGMFQHSVFTDGVEIPLDYSYAAPPAPADEQVVVKPIKSELVDVDETVVQQPLNKNVSGLVKCMTCMQEMEHKMWTYHNLYYHNNLSWLEGEPPIDVNDEKLVLKIYGNIVKSRKMLKCTKCGSRKKSAAGFMSHTAQCQLSKEEREALRIPCEICGRLYAPISIKVHMSQVHNDKSQQPKESSYFDPVEISTKRTAAKKAAHIIHEVSEEYNQDKTVRKCYKAPGDGGTAYSAGLLKYYKKTLKTTREISCKIRKCTYKTKSMEAMKEHLGRCPEVGPDDYICRYCLHVTKTQDMMITHARSLHSRNDDAHDAELSEVSDDDEIIIERTQVETKQSQPRTAANSGVLFYDKEKLKTPIEQTFNKLGFNWTVELIQNYHRMNLFPGQKCLRSNWKKLKQEEQKLYEPSQPLSPFVNQIFMRKDVLNIQSIHHEWKRYKLYASSLSSDTATIYCGGQIYAMAWAPTPLNIYSDQILAVSVQRKYNQNFAIGKIYQTRGNIQFWDFGKLINDRAIPDIPKLVFCLANDHGVAWNMAWCPSGCYDVAKSENPDQMKRLGLLAMACADGKVVVYSICLPETLGRSLRTRYYKPKESFILTVPSVSDQKYEEELWHYQATRVSWSKSNGHKIIAGGFSNGTVCIWDLHCVSPLLRQEQNGKTYLKPVHCFQPHDHVISALDFHITDGSRWLMTGSWDKTSKFWDLEDTSYPITIHKKGLVTDGVWMNNWVAAFTSYEDTFILGHCNSTVQTVRDFNYKICATLATNSIVNNVSGNDWLNGIAQCNLAGELSACFPKQLLFSFDHDRASRYRKMMISYCELIEKNLTVEERMEKQRKKKSKKSEVDISDKDDAFLLKYCAEKEMNSEDYVPEPTTYEDSVNRYGLVFCDIQLDSLKNQPEEMRKWFRQSVNLHEPNIICPLNSVNRCCWNPNYQAYQFIASGLDSGFVRLHCLRFLKLDGE